jgi:hypothetical protein
VRFGLFGSGGFAVVAANGKFWPVVPAYFVRAFEDADAYGKACDNDKGRNSVQVQKGVF